jgi:CoA:oxalate CoA-transferase
MNAAFAILAALHARSRTGRGQFLDVSLLEGQLGLLDTTIGGYRADGIVPGPMGTAYKTLLPYQTFRTRTRDIAIAIGSDSIWRIFCPLLGLDEITDDPRYATNAARSANRASLIDRLQTAFLARAYEEWEAILLPAGIPMGGINTIDRVVDHPQVAARQSLATCNHPVAGEVKAVAPSFRMSDTPGALRAPAPLLGQHTSEVLRELLGLPEADLERLAKTGAIRGSS